MRMKTWVALVVWPPLIGFLFWAAKNFGSLFFSDFMLGWYDLTHATIRSLPFSGGKIDALLRSNFSDGDLAYWSLWYTGALLLVMVRGACRRWVWARWLTAISATALAVTAAVIVWPTVSYWTKSLVSTLG